MVRKHRCVQGSQDKRETWIFTNATWICRSECPRGPLEEWVKNLVEWPASTATWQTAMPCSPFDSLSQGDDRRGATMPGKRQRQQDENDKPFGGLRNSSRTCSADKHSREFGVEMRGVFERVSLQPGAEHVVTDAVRGIGKEDSLGFPTVFVEHTRDKVYKRLGVQPRQQVHKGKLDLDLWTFMLTSACDAKRLFQTCYVRGVLQASLRARPKCVECSLPPTTPVSTVACRQTQKLQELVRRWRAFGGVRGRPHHWQRLYRVVRRLGFGHPSLARGHASKVDFWSKQKQMGSARADSSSISFAAASEETS